MGWRLKKKENLHNSRRGTGVQFESLFDSKGLSPLSGRLQGEKENCLKKGALFAPNNLNRRKKNFSRDWGISFGEFTVRRGMTGNRPS